MHCPFTEKAAAGLPGLPWLVVAITTKRFSCQGVQKKVPGSADALAVLTGAAL